MSVLLNEEKMAGEYSKINPEIYNKILLLAEMKHGKEATHGTVTTSHPELIKLLGCTHEIKKYFYWMEAKGLVNIVDENFEQVLERRLHILLTGKGIKEARYLKENIRQADSIDVL